MSLCANLHSAIWHCDNRAGAGGGAGGSWEKKPSPTTSHSPSMWSHSNLRLTSRWKRAILYIKLHPSYCPWECENLKHEHHNIRGQKGSNSLEKWETQWYSGCHCVVNFTGLKRLCSWCLFRHFAFLPPHTENPDWSNRLANLRPAGINMSTYNMLHIFKHIFALIIVSFIFEDQKKKL